MLKNILKKDMTTKEKILAEALIQLNENGVDNVTVRSIAKAIGISHGNLCYHFPNTDAIIHKLYLQLVNEFDAQIEQAEVPKSDLHLLFKIGEINFKIQYGYKFLLLDFVQIMRRIPAVKEHFKNHIEIRRTQFRFILDSLISGEILREEFEPNMYEHLITRLLIFGNGWIAFSEIHTEGEVKPMKYFEVFGSALLPYLTEKGIEEYRKLIKSN